MSEVTTGKRPMYERRGVVYVAGCAVLACLAVSVFASDAPSRGAAPSPARRRAWLDRRPTVPGAFRSAGPVTRHPAPAVASPDRMLVTPDRTSGQPVGTTVRWTATAPHRLGRGAVYRFSIGAPGGPMRVVRDFSPARSFAWTALQTGVYVVAVTAKEDVTATTGLTASTAFRMTSRITGADPAVTSTTNPLVALYSAPACWSGHLRVQFRTSGAGSESWTSTAAQPCRPGQSLTFIVAGLRADTPYLLRSALTTESGTRTSPARPFTTGSLPSDLTFPAFTVSLGPHPLFDRSDSLLLHLLTPVVHRAPNPVATDLVGRVVWYYAPSDLTAVWPVNIAPGGTILLLGRDRYHARGEDVLREIDLTGQTLRETNIDALNAQLAARRAEPIYSLDHEALRLPNGDTAVLGTTQRTINGQDAEGTMLLVLDANFQVAWAWDAFDHVDPEQWQPILGGTCADSDGGVGLCGLPDPQAQDWFHANAIGWSPADHDLILSLRHQDWVIKIDYRDGQGTGQVLWRLGRNGDFTLTSDDPFPWFSHQHSVSYVDPSTLVVFDNGNTRCQDQSPARRHSRGQVLALDEIHHQAHLLLSVDLGGYSFAVGGAQRLPGGDYVFTSGMEKGRAGYTGRSIEVTPGGKVVYVQGVNIAEYRAYREGSLDAGNAPVQK